jgi:hypothetical protein
MIRYTFLTFAFSCTNRTGRDGTTWNGHLKFFDLYHGMAFYMGMELS